MMERHPHNNLWAEKLSQVSLPDSGTAWLAMEALLDKEMPTGWRRDRRRWLLLILLLLLLIGVCNCPGRARFSAVTGRWRWPKAFQTVAEGDKIAHGPSSAADRPVAPANAPDRPAAPVTGGTPASVIDRPGAPVNAPKTIGGTTPATRNLQATPNATTHQRYTTPASGKPRHLKAASPAKGLTRRSSSADSPPPATSSISGSPEANSPGIHAPTTDSPGINSPAVGSPAAGPPGSTATTTPKKKDSLATPIHKPVVKDSTHKKPAAPPVEKPKTEKDNGWMVGIGLNQFFTVGGQQASSWNSGGITGTIGDYIPVPMVRYYFNEKLYVQLEAQFNTPQYTKKDLVIDESEPDSTAAAVREVSSASINKLFYFNLPLSIHYEIYDNLNLGAGLQFSQLTNGIGNFTNSTSTYNYNNTGTTIDSSTQTQTQTKSFKGDSLYHEIKTNEFRFLIDGSYTYGHFILGLRYNQALSRFINVRIAATQQVTQARNSSLQLYLRYILWDGRKKKPLLPAK